MANVANLNISNDIGIAVTNVIMMPIYASKSITYRKYKSIISDTLDR